MESRDHEVIEVASKAVRRERKKRVTMLVHGKSVKSLPAEGVPKLKKNKKTRLVR